MAVLLGLLYRPPRQARRGPAVRVRPGASGRPQVGHSSGEETLSIETLGRYSEDVWFKLTIT